MGILVSLSNSCVVMLLTQTPVQPADLETEQQQKQGNYNT